MKKKVMIVDDEENIRKVVKLLLGSEGYEVGTAANGSECLEKLKNENYDLILIDMFMPGMSGRLLCENIRNDDRLKSQKVAFLTVAQFSELGKSELDRMGVLDYITKPYDNVDFVRRVKKMLGD